MTTSTQSTVTGPLVNLTWITRQPADEDEQMLVESLREVITKVVGSRHDSLASDWTARLDAVRRDVEQTVQEFGRKIAQQDSRLNGLAGEYNGKLADVGRYVDEINKNHRELTGLLALVRSDLEERCASLGHALEEVRAEVARHAVQAVVTRNEVEHRVTALNSQIEERAREIGLRLDSLAGMVESHRATNETGAAGLKARVVGAEQTLGSLNQLLQGLAATVQTQQETITGLQEALSHVSAQLEPLTAPAAKGRSWRRILDWARGFVGDRRRLRSAGRDFAGRPLCGDGVTPTLAASEQRTFISPGWARVNLHFPQVGESD